MILEKIIEGEIPLETLTLPKPRGRSGEKKLIDLIHANLPIERVIIDHYDEFEQNENPWKPSPSWVSKAILQLTFFNNKINYFYIPSLVHNQDWQNVLARNLSEGFFYFLSSTPVFSFSFPRLHFPIYFLE